MLLVHVESFLEVVRVGSLTRAAQTLFVTQPTLTDRLKSLESDLGTALFSRTRRQGLQLTEAGRAFLPYARRLIQTYAEATQAIASTEDTPRPFSVGVAPFVSDIVLTKALARCYELVPDTASILHMANTEDDLVRLLMIDGIEVAVVRDTRRQDAELEASPLYGDELVFATAPGGSLARTARVRLRDLSNERLVVLGELPGAAAVSRSILRGGGSEPHNVIQVDSAAVACDLIRGGLGVGWLPLTCVTEDLEAGRLVRVTVVDATRMRTRIVALEHRSPTSRTLKAFIAGMREAGSVAGYPVPHLEARPNRANGQQPRTARRRKGARAIESAATC